MFADVVAIAVDDIDVRRHDIVEVPHTIEVDIEDVDICAKACGDPCGVCTYDSTTEDGDVGGRNTGNSPQEYPTTHLGFLEILCTFLNAHPPGDFTHRSQQRQSPLGIAKGLVCQAQRTTIDHGLGEFSVSSEMEISKDRLVFADKGKLAGLGFLNLDD